MSKGKVTVLRRMANHDLIEQYKHQTVAPCPLFEDGQVFTVEDWEEPPERFCEAAWADIANKAELAKRVGKKAVACCTDGFRPVFFEIERWA